MAMEVFPFFTPAFCSGSGARSCKCERTCCEGYSRELTGKLLPCEPCGQLAGSAGGSCLAIVQASSLPKTSGKIAASSFALGLLRRICFRMSDVRLDTGHLSSSMALNKIAQASVLSLRLESNCGLLLAFATGPGIAADEPSLFRFIRAVHSRKILLCLLN